MSKTNATTDASSKQRELPLIRFLLAGHRFGVPIDAVKEAVEVRPITPVFLVPPFIRGIMSLRGEIVPVLDLLRLIGLETSNIGEHSRVVVVRDSDSDRRRRLAGLLADGLDGVGTVPSSAIRPAPATLPSTVADYVTGVVSEDEPLMVLDLERIFNAAAIGPIGP